MATTLTKKHKDFVSSSMKYKSVQTIDGISVVLGGRLIEQGFDQATKVLAQFLLLNMDEYAFKDWLFHTTHANRRSQAYCYECMKEWCDRNL